MAQQQDWFSQFQSVSDDDFFGQFQSVTPSKSTEQPGFLSRSFDAAKGFGSFVSDIVLSGMYPNYGMVKAPEIGRGMAEPFRQIGQGNIGTGVLGLLGADPEAVAEDWENSNYGALLGDFALPIGLAGITRGARAIGPSRLAKRAMPEVLSAETPLPTGTRALGPGPTRLQLPARGETYSPTRFYEGPAGIADANQIHPFDWAEPGKLSGKGTLLPEELGQITDIGPIGGATRTSPHVTDPAQLNPAFRALVPERYSGIQTRPLGLQGIPKDLPESFLDFPEGGAIIDSPPLSVETPFSTSMKAKGQTGTYSDFLARREARKQRPNTPVAPTELRAVANELPKVDKASSTFSEIWNYGRSLMSSYDLSAPLRQGLGLIHKKEYWGAFGDMFHAFGSENAFKTIQDGIKSSKNFKLAEESGLQLTDLLSKREEAFLSSWAERTPIIGRGVRASNRAYVSFLNKLRSDTFSSLVDNVEKTGVNPKGNLVLTREIADFVNNATGRGSLGKLERNTELLNNLLFSPRLISSRLQMLNPNNYVNPKIPAQVRKEYLKSLFAITSTGTALVELGKLAGGEIENDPRSSDFRKLKIGNTRLDPYGGFQQYITLASRLISGESKSSVSGNLSTLGEHYGSATRLDVLGRFGESKAHPVISFATGMLRGKDFTGQPFNVSTEIANRYVPMLIQDIYELAQDDPTLLPLAGLGAFGVGMQTYQPRLGGNVRFIRP